jgi:hypothetical protein
MWVFCVGRNRDSVAGAAPRNRTVQAPPGVTKEPGHGQVLTCPHCGLVLTVRRVKGGRRLSYSTRDWRRLCKYIALDSPALCLLVGGGDGGAAPAPDRSRQS